MTGMNQEMKELQKLSKMDLIILLGELSEELEGLETDNREKDGRIGVLGRENEALRAEKSALAEKNESLMSQIQAANRKLMEMEGRPANFEAVEAVARRMNEIAQKTGEQMNLLREMERQRRKDIAAGTDDARERAQSIIEDAQKTAVGITKQLQKTNMEMLANMQAAIDHARSGYEAAFVMEHVPHGQSEDNIREFRPQGESAQAEKDQVVLSAEQARNLLKVLKRYGKPDTQETAQAK
ncbi:MAG: hypothetical protein VB081_03615 [Christensenella sp.]|uniref:hypothetical protein n=1 Tax=Christensenella sp. TaxID=1935934 RepID=UPI002B20C472|nr:hypothetical protein [Christensenella sp.]MEA5002564.1 hypothetical protein [Christensenella sp.]